MKILITGGAGFIGSNLVKQLQKDDVSHVAVIDDFSTGFKKNLQGLDVEIFEGSILDQDLLAAAAHSTDAIVHLAARPSVPRSIQDPLASHHANATGTLHVLEAARETGAHVTLASSSSVYGSNTILPKSEELRPLPISPYAVSKLATESYALAYRAVYGLEVLPFRFFNVYGPGQAAGHAYAAVIPAFLDAALHGQPLPIHGDGRQTRDFTFVETVTEALSISARERVNPGDAVNLAFGTRSSLLDVVAIMEDILGTPLQRNYTEPRAGDVRDSQADNDALRALFPTIEPVDLHEGISKTIEWFRAEK